MKRRGTRKTLIIVRIAALAAACAAGAFLLPSAAPLLMRAASLSAALSMPESAIQSIAERLKGHPGVIYPQPQQSRPSGSAPAPSQPPLFPDEPPAAPRTQSDSQTGGAVISPEAEKAARQELSPSRPEAASGGEPDAYRQPSATIPESYKGKILSEDMSDSAGELALLLDGFRLRNYTSLSPAELKEVLKQPCPITPLRSPEPQVLIYHTHATESYCPYDDGFYDVRYNWRSTDNNINMVSVGAAMAEVLRENGIAVLHDTAQHDYPSYDGSYANSYRSVKDYLEHYPSIRVVLDIHRDAIERSGGVIVKPVIEYNGERYAQLMLVSNCDDGSGLLPNWRENLRFAAAFCRELESDIPGITRPILFSHRKYNQQLSSGALLLEFGAHANTLEEAQRTAAVAGKALSRLLNGEQSPGDNT